MDDMSGNAVYAVQEQVGVKKFMENLAVTGCMYIFVKTGQVIFHHFNAVL